MVITKCRLMPQQRNWISNLYQEESSLRSKITEFIKRTVLISLLCFYNSQLIQHYTRFIISQKTSCFKCKLMLKQAFSDWKNSFSVYFCTVKLRTSNYSSYSILSVDLQKVKRFISENDCLNFPTN